MQKKDAIIFQGKKPDDSKIHKKITKNSGWKNSKQWQSKLKKK